jgi:hypothetical protein
VPTDFDGERLKLTVPKELVDESAYPAVLDPVISPEFGMDAPVAALSTTPTSPGAVTFNGQNYVAAWRDSRNNGVYATRFTPTGTVLDLQGIPIPGSAGAVGTPAVLSDEVNVQPWHKMRQPWIATLAVALNKRTSIILSIAIEDRTYRHIQGGG